MKFGQEFIKNIYPPWQSEYVDYESIRQSILENQNWDQKKEDEFIVRIRSEVEKVDTFITRKQREIDSRLAYCQRTLSQSNTTPAVYESTDDTLTEILMDLNDLSKYTRYNCLAIQKLVKRHDKYTPFNDQPFFLDLIRSKSLDRQRFDVALIKLSVLHDQCQLHGQARSGNAASGFNQNAFERATAKYWVHPDNVTEVKAILLFHLPVLVFNPDKPIEPEDSAVSSTYFDNPDFDLYQGRLQRDEGAEAIRFRWYGPTDSENVFIERKTHHAPWTEDGASVKDRFRLDTSKVAGFLSGTYTAGEYANQLRLNGTAEGTVKANHFVAAGIQKSIKEKRLEPVLRVFYNRTAFQVPGDQKLRISLDTDLTFVREDGADRRKGDWRRPDMGIEPPFEDVPQDEVYRFPYAVLETKLQTHLGQAPPVWLSRLLESRLVYEVPRFSKYLQGAAVFWNPRLPLLPWWLNEIKLDIRNVKQTTSNFSGLSRSKSMKPLIDGKYRMGYLESQLERSSTLKRANEGKSMVKAPPSSSNRNLKPTKPPIARVASTKNPFDDPIWSQNNLLFDSSKDMGSYETTSTQHRYSEGRQTAEYINVGSTECLVNKHNSAQSSPFNEKTSFFKDNNNNNTKESSLNIYLREDVREYDEERGESKKKKKVKEVGAVVEPKTFFANERTFIHWLHFAATLLSVALTLMNFGDSINKTVGAVFFGIAMVMSIYAFGYNRWRAHRISNKPHLRYDDIYGPFVLCIVLLGALSLNFGLRWNTPSSTTGYLGTNSTSD
ncbi:hypothetical protein K501DRAFT_248665 [Backusella circina FSU 941]|nr:hypothetical protein K501DRAFT_248665 [Backusella circina FSU 941]